jgi:hypothetical protein
MRIISQTPIFALAALLGLRRMTLVSNPKKANLALPLQRQTTAFPSLM